MNDKKYCVYKHTSPSNKVYIGITFNIKRRWYDGNGYLHKRKDGKYNQPLFARAILKYGWDNFKHEIIADNLSKEQACELEKKYIQEYDSTNPQRGYNISFGGDILMYGKKHSKETRKLLREKVYKTKDYYKSINQYDLNGNLIKTWKDSSEIYDDIKFRPYCSVIRKCCHREKHYLSVNNYQWRFSDDCSDIKEYKLIKPPTKVRPTCEINPVNGTIIKKYSSVTECSNDTELSFRRIMDCCRGQTISVDKRLFMYICDINEENIHKRIERFNKKFNI